MKALDQLQDSLLRAEESKKDRDLLIALRLIYMILEDWIRRNKDET